MAFISEQEATGYGRALNQFQRGTRRSGRRPNCLGAGAGNEGLRGARMDPKNHSSPKTLRYCCKEDRKVGEPRFTIFVSRVHSESLEGSCLPALPIESINIRGLPLPSVFRSFPNNFPPEVLSRKEGHINHQMNISYKSLRDRRICLEQVGKQGHGKTPYYSRESPAPVNLGPISPFIFLFFNLKPPGETVAVKPVR